MRLSRWCQSVYESSEDMALEARLLGELVTVLPPRQDAEIVVVTSRTQIDQRFLQAIPSVRLVITTTSGIDHFDRPLLRRLGLRAARLPMVRRDAVVEASLGFLIAGLRRLGTHQQAASAGRWVRGELPTSGISTLSGQAIGVVGLGVIGQQMAAVLQLLGAQVMGCDPRGVPDSITPLSVEEMVRQCGAISLHCDLNPSSRGLISSALLATARPGLVLVNTARGALVDVEAAIAALAAGRLGGLGLDVFGEEPYPRLQAVNQHPNLWLTPHASGYHMGLPAQIRKDLHATVRAYISGQALPHPVD